MTTERKRPGQGAAYTGANETNCGISSTSDAGRQVDVFAEINALTIPELWVMLGLPGEPKSSGTMRSPWRDESSPSFSIFNGGFAFKDHGGEGAAGDGVEFARVTLRTDHAGVRDWYLERSGIDYFDHGDGKTSSRPAKEPEAPKVIEWPAELLSGTPDTWQAFSNKLGIRYAAIQSAVTAGILRFCKVDGVRCYVVTDAANRAGEIRRCDGGTFKGTGKKAYFLKGVDKSWLPGAKMLASTPKSTGILVTEGPKDLLAAIGLYATYRRDLGGENSWIPAALLGSKCKRLHPELVPLFRGRRVRLVPDGDPDGDHMGETWKALLLDLGCTVDLVKMPRGKDLFDLRGEIEPEGLFQ
jgi:hypothetical protein